MIRMGVRQQDGIDLLRHRDSPPPGIRQPAPCTQRISIAAIDQNRALPILDNIDIDRHARNWWKMRCREQPFGLLGSDVLTQNVEGPVFETIIDYGDDEIANPSPVRYRRPAAWELPISSWSCLDGQLHRGDSATEHVIAAAGLIACGSLARLSRQHTQQRPNPFGLGRLLRYYCRRSPNLPHTYACSTIGPARLNFRVRDGNGCDPRGKLTGKILNFRSRDCSQLNRLSRHIPKTY